MSRRGNARADSSEDRRTLTESTTERVRSDIIKGIFKPGDRLMMELLKDRYGTSMSPLREALAGLAAEQFITFERHKGYQVAALSREDLHDLFETRKLLEADIARLALTHGDEVWESNVIAAFHQLAHTERRMIESGLRGDKEWEQRNSAFHEAISDACPLRWLKHLRAQVFMKAQRYRVLAWSTLPDPQNLADEHREIFEATMARDEPRLITAMNVHIDNVAHYARELIPAE